MSRRVRKYAGEEIAVGFEAAKCIHAAECVRGLPLVFDPQRRPWIVLDGADVQEVAEVVERCPTGALTWENSSRRGETAPDNNSIRVRPRGPLVVRGELELETSDGEIVRSYRMALCRCGASSNKPFCDNSHRQIAFSDRGQLASSRLTAGEVEDGPLELRIVPGGPVLLRGAVEVSGGASDPQVGSKGALCRCGASAAKPYCDGSHSKIAFDDDPGTK